MRKRLISLRVIVILVCSIYGCAQTAEDTPAVEPKLVKTENTATDEEELDTAESENEETVISREEYGQNEEQAESIADEPEEKTVVKMDSISQLDIDERTSQEMKLIKKILSQNEEEFEAFLMEDWEWPHVLRWIEISGFDFTKDGEDEIIISKYDVNQNAPITYNYVYDREGTQLLEFIGGNLSYTKIINEWDGIGRFLLHDYNRYGADFYANIYTVIRCEGGVLEEEVKLVEYDTRNSAERMAGKEGYYIFKDLTKEEEKKLWDGAYGLGELKKTKDYVWEDKDLEEYKKLFDSAETTNFTYIDSIVYSEMEGFRSVSSILK